MNVRDEGIRRFSGWVGGSLIWTDRLWRRVWRFLGWLTSWHDTRSSSSIEYWVVVLVEIMSWLTSNFNCQCSVYEKTAWCVACKWLTIYIDLHLYWILTWIDRFLDKGSFRAGKRGQRAVWRHSAWHRHRHATTRRWNNPLQFSNLQPSTINSNTELLTVTNSSVVRATWSQSSCQIFWDPCCKNVI